MRLAGRSRYLNGPGVSHQRGQCRRGGGEGRQRHCSAPTCKASKHSKHKQESQLACSSGRGFLLPRFFSLRNTFLFSFFSFNVSFGLTRRIGHCGSRKELGLWKRHSFFSFSFKLFMLKKFQIYRKFARLIQGILICLTQFTYC